MPVDNLMGGEWIVKGLGFGQGSSSKLREPGWIIRPMVEGLGIGVGLY